MKKIFALILALVMVLSLVACGSKPAGDATDTDGAQDVYEWDYLSIIPTSNPAMNSIVEFTEEVKEATNGRLIITIREPGELPFTNSEFVRAIGNGSAQMGWGLMPSIAGDLESGAILGLPFLVQDSEDLKTAMGVLQDNLEEELAVFGTGMLFYFNMPSQNLFGQGEPISSFDDVSEMAVRSTGSEMADFITSIDAIPVTIDSAEVPTSLSRGVINSVITASLNCYGSNWHETLNWGYMFNLQADTVLTLVNQEALNSLPDDIRATLLDISAKYTDKAMQAIAESENSAIESLKAAGMTFVQADQAEVDAKVAEFSNYWVTWAEEKGGNVPATLEKVCAALNK